jgi:serine phosphatase RsbU (regulator of sigma subunit)
MRRLLFFCFILLGNYSANAQSLTDSLLKVVRTTSFDTARVEAYNELIWEYYGSNNDSALFYGKKSIELAERIGYLKGLSNAHRYTGNVYEQMSDYAKALFHQQRGLDIAESISFKPAIASSLSNIGSIYEQLKEHKKALDYLERSLKLCVELDQKEGIAAVTGNIGNIYYNIKAYSKAIEFYSRSLEMNESIGNPYGIAVSLSNLGNVHIEKKEYQKGIDYHTRSLEIRKQINHKQGMASSLSSLGICHQQLGNTETARKYLEEAAAISKEIYDLNSGSKAFRGLYLIYKNQNEFEKALYYHEEFTRLNDSVFSTQRNEELSNMRTRFALEQQQKELDQKAKEELVRIQAKADAEKQQQQIIVYASVTILVVVILFSLFLFNRFRITNRQKTIIEQQKGLVEEKNKQITDSINYARRIQTALLPSEEDVRKILPESFVLFKPKDIVSGDFYWISQLRENTIVLAVADCTGHGVPGGFMSMLGTSFLNEIVNEKGILDPGRILDLLKDRVITALKQQGSASESKDGMDIAVIRYNTRENTMVYSGANNGIYLVRNAKLLEFSASKMPVGYHYGNEEQFRETHIDLEKNDMVYLYTDGYADQFGGPDGKKFKYARMEALLMEIGAATPSTQKLKMEQEFENWKKDLDQVDDICITAFRHC